MDGAAHGGAARAAVAGDLPYNRDATAADRVPAALDLAHKGRRSVRLLGARGDLAAVRRDDRRVHDAPVRVRDGVV
eukprot:7364138-Prymnesium_polylepis.1